MFAETICAKQKYNGWLHVFLTFTKSENSLVNTLLTETTYWMHQQLMRKRWQYKNCKLHWFQAYKKEI